MAARDAGTLATASRPSSALSSPVATPHTAIAGAIRHGDDPASSPRASDSPPVTTTRQAASGPGPVNGRWTSRRASEEATLAPDQQVISRLPAQRPCPSPACTTVGTNDVVPTMPMPSTMAPTVAPRNRGSRNSAGSSSGDETRVSTHPNTASSSTAAPPMATVAPVTPERPCVRALTSRVSAALSRTRPGRSTRRRTTGRVGATQRVVAGTRTSATAPTTPYTSRHPVPMSRAAASNAPTEMPRATLAPQTAVAWPRSRPAG